MTEELRRSILKDVDEMNDKGFRVLAIAQKSSPAPAGSFGVEDERDMVLMGYLAFLDPPKESTAAALRALKEHGVTAKILTGDHEKVTCTICRQVGLKVRNMLLGSDVARMSGAELARAASPPTCSPSLPRTRRPGRSRRCGPAATLWASWATGSTTRPP